METYGRVIKGNKDPGPGAAPEGSSPTGGPGFDYPRREFALLKSH